MENKIQISNLEGGFDMSRITEVANSRVAARYPDYFGSILTAGCLKFMINIFPTAEEF